MKVIINATRNNAGGGLQIAVSFIEECVSFPANEYYVFMNNPLEEELRNKKFTDNFKFFLIPDVKFYRLQAYLSKLEKQISPDVVFSIFGPAFWRPASPHVEGFANGYYIYPDSPVWEKLSYKERLKIRLKKLVHVFYLKKETDAVVCETQDATERTMKLLGNGKLYYTVSNTFGSHFLKYKENVSYKNEWLEKGGYFNLLTVCNFYIHKNLAVIKLIIDKLLQKKITNIRFVLTLKSEDYLALFEEKYRTFVINSGVTKGSDCPGLYARCDAVFLPSLLECFSANYPEAMVMRKPVLTSDLSFARSVCGDAALYFNPLDPKDIADKIIFLYRNKDVYNALVSKGAARLSAFPSARARAEKYLEICSKIIDKKHV